MDLQKQSSWLEFVWVFLEQHFDRFFLLSSKCCPCAQGFLLQTPNLLSIQERIPEMSPTTASHSVKNRRPALPHLLDMLPVWPVSKRIESVFGWCPCHRLYGQSRDHDPRGVCGFFRRFSRCVLPLSSVVFVIRSWSPGDNDDQRQRRTNGDPGQRHCWVELYFIMGTYSFAVAIAISRTGDFLVTAGVAFTLSRRWVESLHPLQSTRYLYLLGIDYVSFFSSDYDSLAG